MSAELVVKFRSCFTVGGSEEATARRETKGIWMIDE
jgi:hypothetical protein